MANIFSIITNKLFSSSSKRGRKSDTTIIPQYDPPQDLTVAELGLLTDQKGGRLEFLATIYQLKTKKIISLHRGDTGSLAIKLLRYSKDELVSYEDMLLRYFFNEKNEVNLGDYFNREDFAYLQAYFQYQVMQSLQKKGYIFIELGYDTQPYLEFMSKVSRNPVAYVIHYLKNGISKNLTEKAWQTLPVLEGFKQYIETAELDKIKFHAKGSLEEYIELLTPYAIAFDQMERWRLVNIPMLMVLRPDEIKATEHKPEGDSPAAYLAEITRTIEQIDNYSVSSIPA